MLVNCWHDTATKDESGTCKTAKSSIITLQNGKEGSKPEEELFKNNSKKKGNKSKQKKESTNIIVNWKYAVQ